MDRKLRIIRIKENETIEIRSEKDSYLFFETQSGNNGRIARINVLTKKNPYIDNDRVRFNFE